MQSYKMYIFTIRFVICTYEAYYLNSVTALFSFRGYNNAFPVDLYNAFRRAVGEDGFTTVEIGSFMQTWVDEIGYPVLTANINMETGEIALTQVI